jgi:hypothetical protein
MQCVLPPKSAAFVGIHINSNNGRRVCESLLLFGHYIVLIENTDATLPFTSASFAVIHLQLNVTSPGTTSAPFADLRVDGANQNMSSLGQHLVECLLIVPVSLMAVDAILSMGASQHPWHA